MPDVFSSIGFGIGLVLLALVLFPYVLGPVFVLATQRFTVPTELVEIDPRNDPLPESIRGHFSDSYDALYSLGFELSGVVSLPKLVPGAQSICAVYMNRQTSQLANATFIVAPSIPTPLTVKYVEFVTRFSDGTMVQTNNSSALGAFKRLPYDHTLQFFDVLDLQQLYKLHVFHESRHRQSFPVNRLAGEFRGDLVAYMQQAVLEEPFAEQIGTGYLARTSTGFRPTVLGACIMTWQELRPFSQIRKAGRRRQAEELLREFRQAFPPIMSR